MTTKYFNNENFPNYDISKNVKDRKDSIIVIYTRAIILQYSFTIVSVSIPQLVSEYLCIMSHQNKTIFTTMK